MVKHINKLIVVGTCFITSITFGQTEKEQTTLKFEEVFGYINSNYVEDFDGPKITDAAIVAMLKELDPHTYLIPKEEVQNSNSQINGSFVGVGIRFQIMDDTLTVINTIEGGPCEKVGVKAGDQIVVVDGENIAGVGLKTTGVREKLMGDKGSLVVLGIQRKGSDKVLSYNVKRDKIPLFSVPSSYMASDKTGYIKVTSFARTTPAELKDAITKLKRQGMKNLILDLQGNGGGLLSVAKYMSDQFLSNDKMIVYAKGRSYRRENYIANDKNYRGEFYNEKKKGIFEKGKLIVLTDESSASASEIVSGALQDWDRALIVGRRTFGKGLVQRPYNLSDGSILRVTVARYYTPSGRFIQKPYDGGVEKYYEDKASQFEHGEYMHRDSIKLPDSLKTKTLLLGRTVYGGGGIMPDVFVPLDTTEFSDLYKQISRKGIINNFTFEYVDENRDGLLNEYKEFDDYLNAEITDEKLMTKFWAFCETEGVDFNEEDYKVSGKLINTLIKARMATNLWDFSKFYPIYNPNSNEIYIKALELIEGDYIDNLKLDF
jgi:carboxyl-terminal processing protease